MHADHFTADKREGEMQIRRYEGQIDAVRQRKGKLVDMLDTDPTQEVAAAIKRANAEMKGLEDAKAKVEQRVARDGNVERSRAALMAKIDLKDREARMEANALLRRLSIRTEIVRVAEQITYIVKQDGKKVLAVYDLEGSIVAVSYSQETAERMHDRGEIPELEYNMDLRDIMAVKTPSRIFECTVRTTSLLNSYRCMKPVIAALISQPSKEVTTLTLTDTNGVQTMSSLQMVDYIDATPEAGAKELHCENFLAKVRRYLKYSAKLLAPPCADKSICAGGFRFDGQALARRPPRRYRKRNQAMNGRRPIPPQPNKVVRRASPSCRAQLLRQAPYFRRVDWQGNTQES